MPHQVSCGSCVYFIRAQ